jgi:hypothetical protein
VAALGCAGERLEADVVRAAVAGEDDERDRLLAREPVAAEQCAVRGLDAARNRRRVLECDVQGTFQAVVG